MDKEFLEGLGLEEQAVQAVLDAHGKALAAAGLEHAVQSAVMQAGGRSVKAIRALLDMDTIGASADIPAALDKALQQLKKDSAYLFEAPSAPPYARFTGAQQQDAAAPTTLAGALREKMGRR